ncbi:GNAT family N-acetyltransferase, partial [Nanoarchaeota archaeon]
MKKKLTLKQETESAIKDIRKRNQHTYVAIDDGNVIGMVEFVVKKTHKIFKVPKYGHIKAVVVDKKYRKKGIAGKLVGAAEALLRKQGIKYSKMESIQGNVIAQKAWGKYGYRTEHVAMVKK